MGPNSRVRTMSAIRARANSVTTPHHVSRARQSIVDGIEHTPVSRFVRVTDDGNQASAQPRTPRRAPTRPRSATRPAGACEASGGGVLLIREGETTVEAAYSRQQRTAHARASVHRHAEHARVRPYCQVSRLSRHHDTRSSDRQGPRHTGQSGRAMRRRARRSRDVTATQSHQSRGTGGVTTPRARSSWAMAR